MDRQTKDVAMYERFVAKTREMKNLQVFFFWKRDHVENLTLDTNITIMTLRHVFQ
jgi:hypothetical protein